MSVIAQIAIMSRSFDAIYLQTTDHLRHHGCGTYPFGDGENLIARVAALRPKRILELGTALGYTACCFAAAAPDAHIDTIEMDHTHVRLARINLEREGFQDRVAVHSGKFLSILPQLSSDYDICFFDGFAPDISVFRLLASHLRLGGVLICANLSLAEFAAQQALKIELSNSSHWHPEAALEQGGTCVAVKREALSPTTLGD